MVFRVSSQTHRSVPSCWNLHPPETNSSEPWKSADFPKMYISSSCNSFRWKLLVSETGSLLLIQKSCTRWSLGTFIHHCLRRALAPSKQWLALGFLKHQQYQFQPGSHIGIGRIVFFEGLQTWQTGARFAIGFSDLPKKSCFSKD